MTLKNCIYTKNKINLKALDGSGSKGVFLINKNLKNNINILKKKLL